METGADGILLEVVEEDPSPGPAKKAKNEFRRSLQNVVSNKERVDRIMGFIEENKVYM